MTKWDREREKEKKAKLEKSPKSSLWIFRADLDSQQRGDLWMLPNVHSLILKTCSTNEGRLYARTSEVWTTSNENEDRRALLTFGLAKLHRVGCLRIPCCWTRNANEGKSFLARVRYFWAHSTNEGRLPGAHSCWTCNANEIRLPACIPYVLKLNVIKR